MQCKRRSSRLRGGAASRPKTVKVVKTNNMGSKMSSPITGDIRVVIEAISWRSKRSLLLKSVLKTVSAGLQSDRLTGLSEEGGGLANLLPNCILKILHERQTLSLGGLGKELNETLSSGMAMLQIKWPI